MKCPKCGYLGFETTDRCRNCGYDFSLVEPAEPAPELPLQRLTTAPLGDFDLSKAEEAFPAERLPAVDLDRVVGGEPEQVGVGGRPAGRRARSAERSAASAADEALPLFTGEGRASDDHPPIASPPPARPPLSVRRATPDLPRGRSRGPRTTPRKRAETPELDLDGPAGSAGGFWGGAGAAARTRNEVIVPATHGARLAALAIDAALLLGIGAAVLYFTLAIAGLTFSQVRAIPIVPFVAFLLLLIAGYLFAFVAAGGQTIGKMMTGLKVVSTGGEPVDGGMAGVRAAGCLLSLLTAGLAYLPSFGSDGRAVHDRLAGTRVVRVK